MTVYCDSCILIYFLDQTGQWHQKATTRLAQLAQANGQLAISDLVRLECRVQPLRRGDSARLGDFDRFFRNPDHLFTPITSAVFERATNLRADFGFKLADAIHLAAAIEAGCDAFLTNDVRLAVCTAIPIEVLT